MEKISHQQEQNTSLLRRILPVLVVLAVVFLLLQFMASMKTEPAKLPEQPQGFLVETHSLEPTDLTLTISSQGTLHAKRQIALLTEISGKVLTMSPAFTAGGRFDAGDVLVTLDPADYRVAVARAEANLASAQAALDLEQAKSDQAQKDWDSFGKKGQPSDLLLNKPQLAGAKASLKAAQADLMKARRDLEKTEIKAPFAGTVLSKAVDLGQYVGLSGQLGMLAGTEVGEVRLPLSNSDISKLNLKNRDLTEQPLSVVFSDDTGQQIQGTIKRLEAQKDSRTLMNYAVAEINQPFAENILFNTFLQAEITGSTYQDVYAIPSAWMMPNDQVAIYADDKLTIKSLDVFHKTDTYFYVNQGLSTSDQVITTPIQAPENGMLLRRKTTTEDDKANQAASETVGAVLHEQLTAETEL
ncbi:efflux RND transporter periplasmic adaptor subunit [Marinicella sp. S1101]|uniref:efflux RND transporter periplasmic adaptor subunit n=1 Tax=Marinicella marina TaxID=2996016 RepID=UPI002260A1F8|nr:efflux RND transporter periplasmic adaptor subunit [Marinicella marina]MCX7554356.1 efflux RND transporter periplasmic adaptor subunit [Marinicella marina]MDJ1138653.1 efflux RND transporter periplasmic adaptor subunit [Marinicella marina]